MNPSIDSSSSYRQVFREKIRNTIREAIFSGDLKPGDRIIETFWAKELNVSQGPVREAIRDLEAMGLVETIPFKGSRVCLLSKKDIHDNYSVRICLECKSIADAIALLSDQDFSELVRQLDPILEEMKSCAEQGNLRAFSDCDAAFHKAIINSTGNTVLDKLWEQCSLRNWFMFSALTDPNSLKLLQAEHENLYVAILSKNIQEATIILENHLTGLMFGFMK